MTQVLITPATQTASTALLRAKPATDLDKLAPSVVEEMQRRFYIQMPSTTEETFIISTLPPADHTKVWIQSDQNNIPTGRPKVWDAGTSTWKALIPEAEPEAPLKQASGSFFTPAGGSTKTASFATMGSTNYRIGLVPTLFTDGSWQSPPGSFPANFGYFVANKAETLFTVTFYGIPTGGLSWEWDVEARRTT